MPQLRKVAFYASFISCLAIVGFRNMGGSDYIYYLEQYNNIITAPSWEFGYRLIVNVFSWLGFSFSQFVFITSLFCLGLVFKSIRDYSPMPQLTILLYAGSILIFYNMVLMRQAIALSLFVFSIRYIQTNNLWKFLLFNTIALCFHYSAFVAFPLYFIATRIKFSLPSVIIMFVAALIVSFFGVSAVVKICDIVGLHFVGEKMAFYMNSDRTFGVITICKLIVLTAFSVYAYIKGRHLPMMNIFLKMTILYVLCFIMFSKWDVMTRLWMYFEVGYIFMIAIFIKHILKQVYLQFSLYYVLSVFAVYSMVNTVRTFDNGALKKYDFVFKNIDHTYDQYRTPQQ